MCFSQHLSSSSVFFPQFPYFYHIPFHHLAFLSHSFHFIIQFHSISTAKVYHYVLGAFIKNISLRVHNLAFIIDKLVVFRVFTYQGNCNENHLLLHYYSLDECRSVFPFLPGLIQNSSHIHCSRSYYEPLDVTLDLTQRTSCPIQFHIP